MRSSGQFQTFFFFPTKRPHTQQKHNSTKRLQANKNKKCAQKTCTGKKFTYLLICVLCFCAFAWLCLCTFCAFVACGIFSREKNKNCPDDFIYITTEFILLPTWIFFITIFFNYHNLFQLSQSFSIITSFYRNVLYHNLLYYNLF